MALVRLNGTTLLCETPPEVPDGIETDFTTTVAYKAGTPTVWLNGQRKLPALDDGYTEVPPTTIRMKEAPLTGDIIQIQFDPA